MGNDTPASADSGKLILSYLDDWEQWLEALLASTFPSAECLKAVCKAVREHVYGHDCPHTETALAVLVCSNGVRQYKRQCVRCGKDASSSLPHKSLSDEEKKHAIPRTDYDERQWMLAKPVHMQMLQRVRQWWDESGADYRLRTDGSINYESYIVSEAWHRRSVAVRAKAHHVCQNKPCRNPATEVHHLHYDTLGFERDEDLIAVCHSCHQRLQGRCW